MDSLGEGYDFGSIMHYARNTFSRWAWNKHQSGNLLLLFFCSKQTWQPQQWGGLNLHCHTTCPPLPPCTLLPFAFLRVLVFYLHHQFARVGHGGRPS